MKNTRLKSTFLAIAALNLISLAPLNRSEPQHSTFLSWAWMTEERIRTQPVTDFLNTPHYIIPRPKKVNSPRVDEATRIAVASALYFRTFGQNSISSFLWTGVESGNPLTRHEEYRWNSLKESGMYDPAKRREFVRQIQRAGLRNVRFGISNHEIDLADESTWKDTTDMINDLTNELTNGKLNISLDLHHFGIEDRFRVVGSDGRTKGPQSYYLHPEWPEYFASFALKTVQKYHPHLKALTIINEPETVVGFNGEMWHGGFPGWGKPGDNFWYIRRSLQIGMAAVKARLKIEEFLLSLPVHRRPSFLYMHTEAAVYKPYWEEFNLHRRFLVSDMILGHEDLVFGDIEGLENAKIHSLVGRWQRRPPKDRTNFDWVIENYIIRQQEPQHRETLRRDLVQRLKLLRGLHQALLARFGKTMRSETVLAVDYYSHNEDKGRDGKHLNPEPQWYAEQVNSGNRSGLYSCIVDYYNHYMMPIMIGESGTPWHMYGSRWSQEMLIESARAARQGIPFLGYTLYPGIDTWGWESALSVPRDQALYNPSGIMNLEMILRPFIDNLTSSLSTTMPLQ